jgi:hypothetical protein
VKKSGNHPNEDLAKYDYYNPNIKKSFPDFLAIATLKK